MLQEFKVRNYKNFRDELRFSLKTGKNYEFNNNIIENGIIKDCLIIGENASGKTNLGYAILDITQHLTDKNKKMIKLYPNLFSSDDTVYFVYSFKFGESVLDYIYEKKQIEKVTREQVIINGKKIIINDSLEKVVDLKGAENLNLGNCDTNISLVKYVYANTVLDKEDENCRVFHQFMKFVNGMLWFSSTEGNRYMGFSACKGDLCEAIAGMDNGVERLEQFLDDLGIKYKLMTRDKGEGLNIYCKMGEKEVPLSSVMSSGTRALIFFFLWYLQVQDVSFLYIDEFDAFYHTDLAVAVVKKVIDIKNTQAIITSHNTDLLSSGLLRPDCIFKLEDNKIKSFSELTDKALREAHNLQKMYKAGAFND